MKRINAVNMAQKLLRDRVLQADCVVDATAGTGRDTLFLAGNTKPSATVLTFDIQQAALNKTSLLLELNEMKDKVRCILDSHINIRDYLEAPIDVVMFNLGYLPGGSHELTTQADTTILALTRILPHMAINGLISLVAYPGHGAGKQEQQELQYFLSKLPQQLYTASCYSMLNQVNHPPRLYMIEIIGREPGERIASRQN